MVKSLIEEVVDVFEFQCSHKNLKLLKNIDPQLSSIVTHSDNGRIKQVLLNLMANALKFTFEGHIILSVCMVEWNGSEALEFSVTDTGIGISKHNQTKLFRLFGLISENEKINPNGCGIGLTVSKKFVEALDGEIHLRSVEGEGTKVTFRIPLIRNLKSEMLKETEDEYDQDDMNEVPEEKSKFTLFI